MRERSPRERPPKTQEPAWTWGETPAGAPEVLWRHSARPLWAQSIAARGRVVLMELRRVLCREASTGDVLWEQPAREAPDALAYDARGLLLGTGRELRELDLDTGEARWRHQLGAAIEELEADAGAAYAATKGPLVAVDRKDGRQRWKTSAGEDLALHLYPDHTLLVTESPEAVGIQAYDTENGTLRWELAAEGSATPGALIDDVLAVSAHEAGSLGVHPADGQVRWLLETGGVFEAPAVAQDGRFYFTDGRVYAVEADTGAVAWHYETGDEEDEVFSLRVVAGTLYAETWRGRLLALSPEDGALRWERRPGQVQGATGNDRHLFLRVSPAEDKGDWIVAALDRETGDLAWELRSRQMVPDLTLIGDVLVVETRAEVFALRVGA